MIDKLRQRLESLGYEVKNEEDFVLKFALEKAVWFVKNDCNISEIPEGLEHVVIDMAAGKFLLEKKAISPEEVFGIDFEKALKSLQIGDTEITYDSNTTPEQRLDTLINALKNSGRGELSCYRKLRW